MTARGTKYALAMCAAVTLFGCGSSGTGASEEELLGKGGQPVIGGTVSTGDPAVVQMRAYYSGSYGSCTGTLIAPDVVLTAAHCIEDSPQSVKVYFGTYASTAASNEWRSVKSWQSHPQYPHRYINEGHDCAVLVLDQAVSGVAPKPYRKTPLTTAAIGSAARIVGFGHTNGYFADGRRHEAVSRHDDQGGVRRRALDRRPGRDLVPR